MEIERKFLVRELPPDLGEHPSDPIAQGYLALGDEGLEVRVRRRGRKAVLTVKQGSGLERLEEELPLSRPRFDRLWPLTEGRRIEKVRHVIPHDALDVELDVYGGSLAGLVVAEIEFGSRDEADAFVAPAWLGEEITGDKRYANRTLATDGLPTELAAFALAPGESAAAGVWRITRVRLDRAIGRLHATNGDLGAAVHGARKDLKRLRSVVRLARDELGDQTYRRENAALRDAGRRLSGARDSQVMVETLDALTERYASDVPPNAFAAFHAQLVREHERAQRGLRSGGGRTVDGVVDDLRAARGRAATWAADLDGVEGLTSGFERIYRRGRKATRAALAAPDDEPLHELRKRVKDLWYTAEVLRPADPKRTKKLAKQASDLSDVIGSDHDLAVLTETAERHADQLEPSERDLLATLIERRRAELQRAAFKAARRLYARKPKAAARRIGLDA